MALAERITMASLIGTLSLGAAAERAPRGGLTAVPFTDVRISDTFWSPRQQANRDRSIPHSIDWCEQSGRIRNFAKAAGLVPGKFEGIFFNDSDVYKVIEGACYSLATHPDPVLSARIDDIISTIAAAQQKDGYLNTYYTLAEPGKRWTNFPVMHELYCAGHLFEAAVAHYQATGKRTLLDVACRFADHIDSVMGPGSGKRHAVPGHEEIELALMKLWRATGQERYAKLAQHFIDERGVERPDRKSAGEYCQDHKPVREQSEVCGHAVRAMYLYSGMADVAAYTGDKGLTDALDRLWHDLVDKKMYVTGGIGSSASNEGFTTAYDLPNDAAYAETCAAIGNVMWNHRMNLLHLNLLHQSDERRKGHGDAKYADLMEQTLYNGMASGVSLDGTKFFYVNPLASRGAHHRQPWFDCACCPSNMVRVLASLGGYVAAQSDDDIYINLYIDSTIRVKLAETTVTLRVETRYPWEDKVKITVTPEKSAIFSLCLRVPEWCGKDRQFLLNGTNPDMEDRPGYYTCIANTWKAGDTVEVTLPMEVRRIEAHPAVRANAGRVAIQRGPIVYCLEGTDNAGRARSLALPHDAKLEPMFRSDLLGGVTVLTGTARVATRQGWDGVLYRRVVEPESQPVTAVPYCVWDNREAGDMVVWIPECAALAEPGRLPTIAAKSRPSASHANPADSLAALNDQVEPTSSGDSAVPRFTWWDHKGSDEYVQYDFAQPCKVSSVSVYWFDDEHAGGGCRVPASWSLLYRDGDTWKPVAAATEYGVKSDRSNQTRFEPVETSALRLAAKLRDGFSGGILEWTVEE
jgi:uncharacterized protein